MHINNAPPHSDVILSLYCRSHLVVGQVRQCRGTQLTRHDQNLRLSANKALQQQVIGH